MQMADEEVIEIEAETIEPATEVYRFVGNHLNVNANHLAYVLNVIGVSVPHLTYENMPDEIKNHFLLVNVES